MAVEAAKSPNEAFNDKVNLSVIERSDRGANKVLLTADASCLFEFDIDDNKWIKKEDIQGPLIVYERSNKPHHAFIILSHEKKEFIEYIFSSMEFQADQNAKLITFSILDSEGRRTLRGVWISDGDKFRKLFSLLKRLVEQSGSKQQKDQAASEPRVDVVSMLTQAHKNFATQMATGSGATYAGDAAQENSLHVRPGAGAGHRIPGRSNPATTATAMNAIGATGARSVPLLHTPSSPPQPQAAVGAVRTQAVVTAAALTAPSTTYTAHGQQHVQGSRLVHTASSQSAQPSSSGAGGSASSPQPARSRAEAPAKGKRPPADTKPRSSTVPVVIPATKQTRAQKQQAVAAQPRGQANKPPGSGQDSRRHSHGSVVTSKSGAAASPTPTSRGSGTHNKGQPTHGQARPRDRSAPVHVAQGSSRSTSSNANVMGMGPSTAAPPSGRVGSFDETASDAGPHVVRVRSNTAMPQANSTLPVHAHCATTANEALVPFMGASSLPSQSPMRPSLQPHQLQQAAPLGHEPVFIRSHSVSESSDGGVSGSSSAHLMRPSEFSQATVVRQEDQQQQPPAFHGIHASLPPQPIPPASSLPSQHDAFTFPAPRTHTLPSPGQFGFETPPPTSVSTPVKHHVLGAMSAGPPGPDRFETPPHNMMPTPPTAALLAGPARPGDFAIPQAQRHQPQPIVDPIQLLHAAIGSAQQQRQFTGSGPVPGAAPNSSLASAGLTIEQFQAALLQVAQDITHLRPAYEWYLANVHSRPSS